MEQHMGRERTDLSNFIHRCGPGPRHHHRWLDKELQSKSRLAIVVYLWYLHCIDLHHLQLPGWRICWIVGPKTVVDSMQSCGSFLEGGANHPLQLAAIPLLDPEVYKNEARFLQHHFRAKRDYVLQRLEEIGLKVRVPPQATFYIWLDLCALPSPIDIGLQFFEECLKEKV